MKKIMFNDKFGLTMAVLDGRKTQTRRIMKGKPLFPSDEIESAGVLGDEVQIIANGGESLITMKLPFRVGEVVAVAQSYKDAINPIDWVSMKLYEGTSGWNNKMFVRADLMPHQIRITDVRVERLQDISDEDCMKEGIQTFYYVDCKFPPDGYTFDDGKSHFNSLREAFAHLINKVSRKDVWQENPYVFVYDFELVNSHSVR
jgi:hypothetical protein